MTVAGHPAICPSCRAALEADSNYCARCGASLSREQRDPYLGRVVDGRYRVLERIGQGGMGVVYKVEHERMGKVAAMKVLHGDLARDPDVGQRFRREAQAVSKLTSPYTVQTFDFGTADGAMYLVMEYVRGDDLANILAREGPLPFKVAAPVLMQICEALAEAHELGIVHRDLKPENIVLVHGKDGSDHAKVLDFGLAQISKRETSAELTERGLIVGTPSYMAPEQIRGEELDGRADIYSLGALIYRLLTGEAPFKAQTPMGVLTKHLTEEAVAPSMRHSGVPRRVDELVMRALAKEPAQRYASAWELREEIGRVLDELRGGRAGTSPVTLARPPVPQASSARARLVRADFDDYERALRRSQWVRTALIPLVVIAAGGGGLVWWRYLEAQPQSIENEPNDAPATATRIGADVAVHGTIGKRLTADQGDRDYFVLVVNGKPGAPVKLSAELTALPNIDLELVVYDGQGRELAVVDALGVGEREVLPNLGVSDSRVYLLIEESKAARARRPTENLSDEYLLTVRLGTPTSDEELEPNDSDDTANALALDRPLRGTLATIDDIDRFQFSGAEGRYEVEVSGAEMVPLALRVDDIPVKGRKARVALRPGTVLAVERTPLRTDGGDGARRIAPAPDAVYTLVIRP